jgi:hypothetical protein
MAQRYAHLSLRVNGWRVGKLDPVFDGVMPEKRGASNAGSS